MRTFAIVLALSLCAGCGAVVEPGHQGAALRSAQQGPAPRGARAGLLPRRRLRAARGLRRHVLDEAGGAPHDVARGSATGSASSRVIYRPIVSELYQLDTEIGPNYYDEVVGPELRSAARGVFARHSYAELEKKREDRGRDRGRRPPPHRAASTWRSQSVTIEDIDYAPEIAHAAPREARRRAGVDRGRRRRSRTTRAAASSSSYAAAQEKLGPRPRCARRRTSA